jgi:hypothetical protein
MAGDIQAIQKNINTNGESYATAETKGGGRFSGSNIQAL